MLGRVSNVNGPFAAADNNGFISRIGPDGVAELNWMEGGKTGVTLNAPKGMELSGGASTSTSTMCESTTQRRASRSTSSRWRSRSS